MPHMLSFEHNEEQKWKETQKSKTFEVVEPYRDVDDKRGFLAKTIAEFQDQLVESAGRSLGYPGNLNCSHYIALSPLLNFHINNAGDPFIESNFALHSKKFEVGVLDWFAKLWGIEKDEYWGYITNGGTEGNLQGLLLGRELLPDGILYVSSESHYSIFKAARMYRMDCIVINTSSTGEIDCSDLKEQLILNKEKPAIINLNIGTTFKGGIDEVDHVVQTLYDCGFSNDQFYIHCDAALYGLILPLLEQGSSLSFRKPIGSISVSAHKLLGSPMPCGVFMTRNKYMSLLAESVEYIASVDSTISGSRNGHAALFIWYGLSMKGIEGLTRDVKMCLDNARYLKDGLKESGISAMLNDKSNIVVFERPQKQGFADYWQLSCVGNMAHVCVMPHVSKSMLDEFLYNLARERKSWYGSCNDVKPPCLSEEIGILNCDCLRDHNDGLVGGK